MIAGKIRLEKEGAARASVTVALSTALRIGDHRAFTSLESVRRQELRLLDLVLVNDERGGDSGWLIRWMRQHHGRFNRLVFCEHLTPLGHAGSMRTALELVETDYVLTFHTDYSLARRCAARCLETSLEGQADVVLPLVAWHAASALPDDLDDRLATGAPALWRAGLWTEAGGNEGDWGGSALRRRLRGRETESILIPEILAGRGSMAEPEEVPGHLPHARGAAT